jgi:putative ABC transport system permease protein
VSLRGLRASVIGETGVRLVLALAGLAGLTTFVAAAGPREVATEQITALRHAAAAIPALQRAVYASASWFPPGDIPTSAQQANLGQALIADLNQPITPDSAGVREWVTGPPSQLTRAAPSAILTGLPLVQVSYDSGLAADSRLLAGRLPTAITKGVPGTSAADRKTLVVQVAVTSATAARFSVRPGSLLPLASAADGQPIELQVSGIVAPSPGQFWNSTQVITDPVQYGPATGKNWLGGAVIGQQELRQLEAALWPGKTVQGEWFIPVNLGRLTPALVSPVASAITAEVAGGYAKEAVSAVGGPAVFQAAGSGQNLYVTSQLPTDLATIQSQMATADSLDSFVIAGVFAAALLLILLCAGLAADRYQAEFTLIRARGGSVGQVARQALVRAFSAGGPGIAAGLALAIWIIPQGNGVATGWVLAALTALCVLLGIPLRCAWRVRGAVTRPDARAAEITAPGRSARRAVAELTVVVAAAAAVVALETRGLAAGSNELALAIPLLVAAAVSIVLARLYPIPVRLLIPLATRGRGPVGFIGLARAGRSGFGTLLPALALVLTMTLAAFGWMVAQTVYAGQVASSWVQTGADAVVTAAGNNTISASDQRAFAKVPGVRHTALAYTATATGPFAATLFPVSDQGYAAGEEFNTGLLVTDPGQYAALASDTPWPAFPARALARRAGPVPVLISAGAASDDAGRAVIGDRQILVLGGVDMPVVVEGTISATPAFPSGGNYVVLPQWAVSQFPSIAGMTIMLATGPRLSPAAMTAAARLYVHGGPVLIRSVLLHGLRTAASEYAVRLFLISVWITVALSLVALTFGLAATAQSRMHLRTRMTALGMSARQARALALTDTIPLLAVAILGMTAAGAALVLISGQVVNLGPLTGSGSVVPVRLDWPALVVPAAAAIVLALAGVGLENWRAGRADSATALRADEVG